jgi:hypothetical protein
MHFNNFNNITLPWWQKYKGKKQKQKIWLWKICQNNNKHENPRGADEGVHIFSNEGLHLSPEDSRIGRHSLPKATNTTSLYWTVRGKLH